MRSLIGTVIEAWRRGIRALGSMPIVASVALLLTALIEVAGTLARPVAESEPTGAVHILDVAFALASSIALVPLAITVHRFVLLGEITPRYRMNVFEARFVRFAFYTVVLDILEMAALKVRSGGGVGEGATSSDLMPAVVGILLLFAVLLLWMMTLILFPAIAVDAPRPAWRDAIRDSTKHFWAMLAAVLMAGAPFVVVYLLLYGSTPAATESDLGTQIFNTATETALGVLNTVVYAALASQLYLDFADRLTRPIALTRQISVF